MRETHFWPGNPVSYTTTKMTMRFGDQVVGIGSAFVMRFAGKYALVTNWHVLSGRSPIDERCLSAHGGIPDRASFHVTLSKKGVKDGASTETLHFKQIEVPLYRSADFEEPVWLDERTPDNQADYAVILLEEWVPELADGKHSLRCIEAGKVTLKLGVKPSSRVKVEDINHFYPPIGNQVFITGYPAGIEPSGIFPIWKAGTIASEPSVGMVLGGVKTDDVLLVDGLTRAGMSGSPVVCLQKAGDLCFTDDGVQVSADKDGPLLVGVYAGREGVTAFEADMALGRVWKVGAIERLLSHAIRAGMQPQAASSHD